MKKFDYIKADSYEEAGRIVKEAQGSIDPIAAGTDALGGYKDRLLPEYPDAVVSIRNIPGNNVIEEKDGKLLIGAGATLKAIADSELVQKYAPALSEAAYSVASYIHIVRCRGQC